MFGAIACRGLAFSDISEFAFDKLLADRRDTVSKDMRLEVVVFVLDDTRGKVRVGLRMRLKIFILVADSDGARAYHILGDTRQ